MFAYGRLRFVASLGALILALGCSKRPSGERVPQAAGSSAAPQSSTSATGTLPGAATPMASAVAAPVPSAAASAAKAWVQFTELPPSRSLAELYAAATHEPASGRSITYKKQKDDWFVVSGHAGAAIYYEKTARLEGRNLRFSFEFPAAERKDYDEDTAYMASSFRALGAPAPDLPKGRCSADGDCPKGYHCPPNGFCTINWGD